MGNARVYPLIKLSEVVKCIILRRINRFVVEVFIVGSIVNAYMNNTGKLVDYLVKGKLGYCIPKHSGRTRYVLVAIRDNDLATLIDTRLQTKAFEVSISKGLIPWLKGCFIVGRNVRLGDSIVDYLVGCDDLNIYLEVKSAVLRCGDYAMYTDCPSARGRRHMAELLRHRLRGGYSAVVFIAALPHVKAFRPNCAVDEKLCTYLHKANEVGVLIKSVALYFNPRDGYVYLYDPDLKVVLSPDIHA